MQDLEKHQVRIRELLTRHKRTLPRKPILTQMPLQSLQIPWATLLTVSRIILLLVRREITFHEPRPPINHHVADPVDPEHLGFAVAIVGVV